MLIARPRLVLTVLATLLSVLMSVGLSQATPPAQAAPAPTGSGPDEGNVQRYIVELTAPAVPGRALAADGTALRRVPTAASHRRSLRSTQSDVLSTISTVVGRRVPATQSYTDALNGVVVDLTADQANQVAALGEVASVTPDEVSAPDTDNGPATIGAPSLWDGVDLDLGTRGEGMLIGIIDTGLNPANPAFAATVSPADGGDGYVHSNPLGAGNYLGMCDPANVDYQPNWGCTAKLIGAYRFGQEPAIYDNSGHGTHVASTAAGNQQGFPGSTARISGVAPHANLISYDVCPNLCAGSDVVAAIDQAIRDDVDVLNHSIGATNLNSVSAPWRGVVARAMLSARQAGIHVVQSAGNNGTFTPTGESTVVTSGDLPWLTSVAATTHSAVRQGALTHVTASGGETRSDVTGGGGLLGLTTARPIVDARSYGTGAAAGQCFPADLTTADFTGAIVLCDRGTTARVEKSAAVKARGAVGMILVNTQSGQTINVDAHTIPAVHLSLEDGNALRAWMAARSGVTARISGLISSVDSSVDPQGADVLADFSSRGPNRSTDTLAPHVAAPGVNILAAHGTGNQVAYFAESGTSMAAPHVTGGSALLAALHPSWTPAELQSALMLSASTGVKDTDGSRATWFEQGAGRIDLPAAAKAGLVLDVDPAAYLAANPEVGGDPRDLNMPALVDSTCVVDCTWTRTVTATGNGVGTWTVGFEGAGSDELDLSSPTSTFTLTEGESADLEVTAGVSDLALGAWRHGTVILTPPSGAASGPLHLPVSVKAAAVVAPDSASLLARRTSGSRVVTGARAVDGTALSVSALVSSDVVTDSVGIDPTPEDPYGDATQVDVVPVTVAEGATVLRIAVGLSDTSDASADLDLRVGVGPTASAASVRCNATTLDADEVCVVRNPTPGTWWVQVQAYAGATPELGYRLETLQAGVGDDRLTAERTTDGRIRVRWNEPDMEPDTTASAMLFIGSTPTLLRLRRTPLTDVTTASSATTASPTTSVTFTTTIDPDVEGEAPTYTITDTPGAGMRITSGSTNAGGTTAGGTVTWHGTHAELAAAAGTPVDQPVVLRFTATVAADQVPGRRLQRVVTHTTDDPGTTPQTLTTDLTVGPRLPVVKTSARISILSATAKIKIRRTRLPLTVRVTSNGRAATGTFTLRATGAGRTCVAKVRLVKGKGRVTLPRYVRTGRVSVTVSYSGSTVVRSARATKRLVVIR